MQPAASFTNPRTDHLPFQPTAIDGSLRTGDIVGLMATAAFFDSFDALGPPIDDEPSPSIWDDALDYQVIRY